MFKMFKNLMLLPSIVNSSLRPIVFDHRKFKFENLCLSDMATMILEVFSFEKISVKIQSVWSKKNLESKTVPIRRA